MSLGPGTGSPASLPRGRPGGIPRTPVSVPGEARYTKDMDSKQKIVQYLNEAHASELGLVRVLQSQSAMTPRGDYRSAVEQHLRETREHARRIETRVRELDGGDNPVQVVVGAAETVIAQALALGKTPFDLLRGTGGEEKVLKNARDAAATEALEIATYTSLERLATGVGDERTAQLAASIRADEERMLERILDLIPALTDAVAAADLRGEGTYDVTRTGAADAARAAGREATSTARSAASTARGATRTAASTGRSARRTAASDTRTAKRGTGSASRRSGQQGRRSAGGARGKAGAAGGADLPIPRYDALTADEIAGRLSALSQVDLGKVEAYERKGPSRSTVLDRIASLRGDEPWAGYDEQNVAEIRSRLERASEDEARAVRDYERAHKDRAGVVTVAKREAVSA
jgi:ferritin-like metal-binding protein YciE